VKAGGTGSFATIQVCANAAAAGDTCTVFAGTYSEYVNVPSSGTAAAPLTFQVNPGDTAFVTGFTVTGRSYITINGFSLGNHSNAIPGIYLSGTSHVTIMNNAISYTGGDGIQLNSSPWPSSANCAYTLISNNTISWTGWNLTGGAYGIDVYGDYNLIDSNDISHAADYTHVHGSFDVIRNNNFHDSDSTNFGVAEGSIHIDGMQTWGVVGAPLHHLLMERNVMSNVMYPNEANVHLGLFDDGTTDGGSDAVVRYNTYYSNNAYFTIVQNNMPNVRIYNNTIANATAPQSSIANFAGSSPGGVFLNNILYATIATGFGYDVYADSTSPVSRVANSLVYAPSCGKSCAWAAALTSEPGAVLNKNPSFINPASNFTLQSGSPAFRVGTYLTTVASGDKGSGTSLVVTDAGFFQDGSGIINADWIRVGPTNTVQIASIDYATNTITLTNTITRSANDPVYLYKDSNGNVVLFGTAPDIGAYQGPGPTPPAGLTAIPH
jgi:hypothetical protein